VAGWSAGGPRAVGEVIRRMRGSRRNSNCAWTRTHDALCYLVRESMNHVAVEIKRWEPEAGEDCGMIAAHERMLDSRTACLLSLPMAVCEPLLCSCHVPDRATNVPFLSGENRPVHGRCERQRELCQGCGPCATDAGICVSYGLSGAVCGGCGPNRRPYPLLAPKIHTGEFGCRAQRSWEATIPRKTDKSRPESQKMTHLEFIGSISTLEITPSCPRLGFVRFELASDGACLKIGKGRVVLVGEGHVNQRCMHWRGRISYK
jgi:hypothetical protein